MAGSSTRTNRAPGPVRNCRLEDGDQVIHGPIRQPVQGEQLDQCRLAGTHTLVLSANCTGGEVCGGLVRCAAKRIEEYPMLPSAFPTARATNASGSTPNEASVAATSGPATSRRA